MSLSCYVASPWVRKVEAKAAREELQKAGFIVTSTWLDLPDDLEATDEYKQEQAENDIRDLFNADVLVLLNLEKSEGKACEVGMAIASGIPVICVGSRQNNVFLHLPEILQVDTLAEAIQAITNLQTFKEELFREASQEQGFLAEAFNLGSEADA